MDIIFPDLSADNNKRSKYSLIPSRYWHRGSWCNIPLNVVSFWEGEHSEACDCAMCCPDVDPWDVEEVKP
ncbi:MAG TPA: hypothetical protein VHT73_18790 [Thermodesulfobacteriota bacterium]|nr:hypothetical protein [Thermodesulfobacteriota bacterium]